jgi:hypothetical protein
VFTCSFSSETNTTYFPATQLSGQHAVDCLIKKNPCFLADWPFPPLPMVAGIIVSPDRYACVFERDCKKVPNLAIRQQLFQSRPRLRDNQRRQNVWRRMPRSSFPTPPEYASITWNTTTLAPTRRPFPIPLPLPRAVKIHSSDLPDLPVQRLRQFTRLGAGTNKSCKSGLIGIVPVLAAAIKSH